MTNEEMLTHYDEDEITHYGVKGMKWGIRRDHRILENHRRNVKVKDIKKQYKSGKISKAQKQKSISDFNAQKKTNIENMKTRLDNMDNETKVSKLRTNIGNQTLKEVPHARIKRGLSIYNQISTGLSAIMSGPTAPAALGYGYLIQIGIIDKLS